MASRIAFILITVFWLTMNVLLWRFESGTKQRVGGTVPVDLIINRILSSPDTSSLEILRDGENLGFCRFASTIRGQASKTYDGSQAAGGPPEGMVPDREGYNIDFEGNLALNGLEQRLRFDLNLKLGRDRKWTDLYMRLNVRPTVVEVRASAADQTVEIVWDEQGRKSRRLFRLGDQDQTDSLLAGLTGPMIGGVLGDWGILPSKSLSDLRLGLKWKGRYDWMEMGTSTMRVYRLETRVFEKWTIVVTVSRVGEILSVQLPDGIMVVNDGLNRMGAWDR